MLPHVRHVAGLHAQPAFNSMANMPSFSMKDRRPVEWLRPARRDFAEFPSAARDKALDALGVIAEGQTPEIAKPLTGLGSGVWELAIKAAGDAYRVVYALQLEDSIWIIHAFQKKSKTGIATPKHEIDVVRERLKRLKAQLL